MNRINISIPETILFQTQLKIQIGDINYGNHLANDAILRLCHEARLRFLNSLGYSELNTAGSSLIMVDAMLQFQNQAFYGDDLIFSLNVEDISYTGFSLIYIITGASNNLAIAKVKTNMVFFNYQTQRIQKTPLAFIQRIFSS